MTDRPEPGPPENPPATLPVDLLADLDGGFLDGTEAARVRTAAAGDPRAVDALAGLAATRAELAGLADPPLPPELAARWDAALAAAAEPPAEPAADPPAVRTRRARWARRPALVAAVALAAAVVVGVFWAPGKPPAQSLDGVDLVAAGLAVRGQLDAGPLTDPVRRAGCLRAVDAPGVAPDAALLGGREVVVDGHPAVLLLLAGGPGRPGVHVVVVDPGCDVHGGRLLRTQTIGR